MESNEKSLVKTGKLTEEAKNEVQALAKQACLGDCNVAKPTMFSMGSGSKKEWESWNAKKGMSKKDAAAQYIKLVKQILS